jgi:hypothetical protein
VVILATGFHSQAAQLFAGMELDVDDKGLPRRMIVIVRPAPSCGVKQAG